MAVDWTTTPLTSGAIPANHYSCTIGGLSANTIYEYRAYMVVNGVPYYGETCTTTTLGVPTSIPSVTTGNASNIDYSSMNIINNSVDDKGIPATILEYGVLYSQNPSTNLVYGGVGVNKQSTTADFIGTYTNTLPSLMSNTVTYYRAFAKNATGVDHGTVYTQQTQQIPPAPQELTITSSVANYGNGTLNFAYGEPNETLNLKFNLVEHVDPSFISLNFDNPTVQLDTIHQTKNSVITLDSNGAATGNYEFIPNNTYDISATVTITSRSIGTLPVTQQSTTVSSN